MAMTDVVLGVDIGGTNTKYGLVDREGHSVAQTSIPTNGHESAETLISRLHDGFTRMLAPLKASHVLRGIGMGAPNANFFRGTVENPPNLNWKGVVPVADLVRKYYDLPVALTNDANAAALGEMLYGAAKGMKNFIVITLGTGLGSGIVSHGELVYGADGFAGEIGHTMVDPDGRECGCGLRGHLETYASATGLCRTVSELLAMRRDESPLRKIAPLELTSRAVADAANAGDPIACEAFEVTGHILGMKLADSVAHLSPEAIILFGGLAAAGPLIFEPTARSLEEHLLPIFRNKVRLIPSALGEGDTAVLGAAALIWNELLKQQKP
ncbi:MAG TPA: ROK family protein [Bacteroidota bacterium]|nr:ROK family protein [Bacteroidota bacterium]